MCNTKPLKIIKTLKEDSFFFMGKKTLD